MAEVEIDDELLAKVREVANASGIAIEAVVAEAIERFVPGAQSTHRAEER